MDRANFHTIWRRATRAAGVADYHFHDLRHLAATMAAVSEATTRELMRRMGHSSQRAALVYQHATQDRDLARPPAGVDLLRQLVERRADLQRAVDEEVDRLAAASVGWPQIAAVLGVTRQAARQSSLRRRRAL